LEKVPSLAHALKYSDSDSTSDLVTSADPVESILQDLQAHRLVQEILTELNKGMLALEVAHFSYVEALFESSLFHLGCRPQLAATLPVEYCYVFMARPTARLTK
jgi:hypothetical protein